MEKLDSAQKLRQKAPERFTIKTVVAWIVDTDKEFRRRQSMVDAYGKR